MKLTQQPQHRFDLSSDEEMAFFDENLPIYEYGEITDFLEKSGSRYGANRILLTDADIEKLKSGQMLVWGQGEYATVIYYGEVELDDNP